MGASKTPTASSLWDRKRDLFYFVFFSIHIPIVFCKSSPHCSAKHLNAIGMQRLN